MYSLLDSSIDTFKSSWSTPPKNASWITLPSKGVFVFNPKRWIIVGVKSMLPVGVEHTNPFLKSGPNTPIYYSFHAY